MKTEYFLLASAKCRLLHQALLFFSGTNKNPLQNDSSDMIKKPSKSQTLHTSNPLQTRLRDEEAPLQAAQLTGATDPPQSLQRANKVSRWLAFPKLASFISLAGAGKCQGSGLRPHHKGSD